ncbi:MAG TPA: translation initiation factor IF-2 [Crinalium sp.]|jgi:translation initiation factor IF-2
MNNGKVRIYELSKELNLDNRDILAVCDQLNITVKSHSSTISDAEAARIRSAAEKYTPSHSSVSSKATPSNTANTANTSSRPSGLQPPIKKQQILEVRKHRPTVEAPRRPDAEVKPPLSAPAASQQVTEAPPRPPARPSVPARPVKMESKVEEEETISSVEDSAPPAVIEPETVQPVVSSPVEPELVPDVVEEDPSESPELVSPPARPVPRAAVAPPSQVNRPTLKRRTEQSEPRSAGSAPSRSQDSSRPEGSSRPRPVSASAQTSDAPTAPKKVIELRRKPVRPGAGSDDQSETGELGAKAPASPGEVLDLELKRPTPPRPPKRAKSWEEEDDEQEAAQKAGKAGTKTKRRSQPLLDEDEDIEIELLDDEDDLSGEPAPVQVSLSLARPPKPKGKPTQAKPAAAPTQKNRKPSGGSDRSFRRDRREQEVKERPTQITLRGSLSVHDLAEILSIPETDIIKTLFLKGIAANVNQILDIPTATMVAQEIGIEVETAEAEAEAKKVTEMLDATDLENLQRRPPVVTIMGHVDHGKTTLLDSIRKTKVAQGEAGGITQHIGAYHVDVEHDGRTEQVVFLDTPGHEAFTAMRARGARVTDVAVLVVAADDGVRPQTIEAISHAKAAEVPIVVAINKVDKEEAQPDRVKQELTEYGLVAEEWGGDTIMVPVSALTGENLDNLLEMLLLVSEVEDLYANPDRLARGTVIEANLDKARGPVATLLIQNGTLRVGDILVAGSAFGKVRAMVDDRGKRVKEASPSFAVEVLGLNDVPAAGDDFEVYSDEKEARNTALGRVDQQRQSRLQQAMASRRVSLNTLSAQAQEGELKELNLVLKADVQGSLEAILAALQQLPQKEVQVRVLLSAPGEITETDVDLAAASNAVIVGFNTTFASGARQAADQAGVDVRDYNIIYKLLEDIQGAMEGLLEPELVEEPLGQVEVRAVFPVGRGNVAGCYVLSGKAIRNCKIRVRRGGEVVYEGNLDSLKRMKDDAKEVNAGFECGIRLDGFNNWSEGDIIETYRLVTKRRTLSA